MKNTMRMIHLQSDLVQCHYYTENTINDYFDNCRDNNLNLFHANIRSFASNYDEISVFLDSLNTRTDIIVMFRNML